MGVRGRKGIRREYYFVKFICITIIYRKNYFGLVFEVERYRYKFHYD